MANENKTRNGGQWTEARFRSFITSGLRATSRRWPPRFERLKAALVGVRKNKKTGRDAKHYACAACEEVFPSSGVQVDHIEPIGEWESWDEFIEKLFCEADNLQVLCRKCHLEKTKKERGQKTISKAVGKKKSRKNKSLPKEVEGEK